jgi:IS30 family transposase
MYHHLNQEERYQIYSESKAGFSVSDLAKSLGRHRSTIYRELLRNRGGCGYRPKQAHGRAEKRRSAASSTPRIPESVFVRVEDCLNKEWSPEQISGRLKQEGIKISHERVYQHVIRDRKQGGVLHKRLRYQKKYRKKRCGRKRYGGPESAKRVISERPAEVETRNRCGDFEGDTIVGKNHKGAIVSHVCRRSLVCTLSLVETKSAAEVSAAILRDLLSLTKTKSLHTITYDNGTEFSDHKILEGFLQVPIYFARPYHSNDRATNENTNGLVRQYFPKGTDFSTLTQRDVKAVQDKLNNRPRKCLGYKTPLEVFRVALQT